ncbi:hypothetical protein EVAR_48750_1 [Eumeta japonica]|uniref:Uncharacterized protein n=1 Tax=Eumeta variegata TaxID=151549 RepID=A0A4C1YJ49_EUMVA|nr:hypothetical protein EVAR_48750_1 [Eumeta japonica]
MVRNYTLSIDRFRPFFLYFLLEAHQLLAVEILTDGFARRPIDSSVNLNFGPNHTAGLDYDPKCDSTEEMQEVSMLFPHHNRALIFDPGPTPDSTSGLTLDYDSSTHSHSDFRASFNSYYANGRDRMYDHLSNFGSPSSQLRCAFANCKSEAKTDCFVPIAKFLYGISLQEVEKACNAIKLASFTAIITNGNTKYLLGATWDEPRENIAGAFG